MKERMCGFTLIGPDYVFRNKLNVKKCSCTGFTSLISQDLQDTLLHESIQKLDFEKLPNDIVSIMDDYHLGDNLYYEVMRKADSKILQANVHHHPFGSTNLEFKKDVKTTEEDEDVMDSVHTKVGRILIKSDTPWYRKK
jgi:phage terminase large subunit